ncbi:CRAL-TRIO lipid binding domain containing protein [Trema orientale]|uniref:CRAL-TRIO lipid binding domain containing protein n=1 Tax=Trema orientale TaxID=63057 RepID=A0A2P5F880_TREOI|nr:CRAL-TRIO lipid binding domain containing protein [Trema orientale]
MSSSPCSALSLPDQLNLIEKLQVFKIQGRDKRGLKLLHIIGKFFPARLVSSEALKKYLENRVFPKLDEKPFSVVYIHTDVQRSENFPGISTFRSIYEAIPAHVKDHIEAVYFVHPGIQARLFLATFGRFLFSGGLYQKLNYVTRLEFLWDHVRRNEIEVPEFVYDHDEELEYRPMMDYGIESDHPTALSMVDSPLTMYSMRCIA